MSHETSHSQHGKEHSDHMAWQSDCHHWHLEHDKALATLGLLEAHLNRHDAEVSEHEFLVGGHERANQVQEAMMAKAERGASTDAPAGADPFLGAVHERQAKRHAALRARHLTLMAHIHAINKLMASES